MDKPIPTQDSRAWEKELAPRISRGYLILTVAVFLGWIAFMGYFAIQRWFVNLQ